MKCNVIWIDEDLDNEENKKYAEELYSFGSLIVRLFKNLDKAIEHMKYIEFQETKVIVSGKLYPEFVTKFKENIIDMCVAPKIIIFTRNKQNESESKKLNYTDDIQLTFEYIDKKEKLLLPLFFKTLIDNISNNNMERYTSSLYDEYSKNEKVNNLLGSIKNMSEIPIEILSKYYARLYTAESDFYKNINKDLGLNRVEKYLPYIKILYEGVKLKSLPLANKNILYRGSKISNDEIIKIKEYINKKIKDLPSSIVFSKSFLSFTKDKNVADYFLSFKNNNKNLSKVLFILEKDDNIGYNLSTRFLSSENKDKNLSKVLFILEKDDNIGYNLSTHGDIEKISFIPDEREVLFFPFSSFEVKDIKEINIGNERGYEIKLLYLGKYLKEIENDSSIISKENPLPNTEFKKQLCEAGLIKQEKVENVSAKSLYQNFKDYEKGINIKNRNFIIGEIYIKPNDINKDIRIINTFENYKRQIGIVNKMDDWKYENEYEIVTNTEIKINGIINKFSYFYKFPRAGKYIIQYSFKNYLTKTNHMFWGCNLLTFLNLSNFNTKNVTNMCAMFGGCNSLTNLNLFNLNTQNVTNMSRMFLCCYLLKDLDLSSFNIQNVINMNQMFLCCYSLTSLNLLNFNTQNVIYMNNMFDGCNLLNRYNIIARDNKILSIFDIKKSGQFNITNSFFK